MEVFVGAARRAYLEKRSKREMAVATFLVAAVIGALGLTSAQDEKDRQAMSAEFTPALRKSVVSSWAGVDIVAQLTAPERGR